MKELGFNENNELRFVDEGPVFTQALNQIYEDATPSPELLEKLKVKFS
jgi:hypothetical protein